MNSGYIQLFTKIGNVDLSAFAEDFSYEDADDKDAYAEFRLNGYAKHGKDYLMNSLDIEQGKSLQFSFGLIGGFISPIHEIVISDVHFDYSQGRAVVVLKCLDNGSVLKRGAATKVWNKVKASDIATQIADKYGMATRIDTSKLTYKCIPQSGRTDFEMLQYLAHKEGGFNCYVSNNTLVFEKINLAKQSKRLFTFGENLMKFSTNVRDSHKTKGSNGVVASGVNHLTEKTFSQFFNLDGINGAILGKVSVGVPYSAKVINDAKGKITIGVRDGFSADKVIKDIVTDTQHQEISKIVHRVSEKDVDFIYNALGWKRVNALNDAEAAARAEGINEDSKKHLITANLEIELDNSFKIGDIITLGGFIAERDKGNWYVKEFRHKIKPAVTELKLSRNAVSKGSGEAADGALNKTVGKETSKPEHFLNTRAGEFVDLNAKSLVGGTNEALKKALDIFSTKK